MARPPRSVQRVLVAHLQPVPGYGLTVVGMQRWATTRACTLPRRARPERLAEFDVLVASALRGVELDGTVVRLRLAGEAGLVERVRELAGLESTCCPFLAIEVVGTDRNLTVELSVTPSHRDLLDALHQRAVAVATGGATT